MLVEAGTTLAEMLLARLNLVERESMASGSSYANGDARVAASEGRRTRSNHRFFRRHGTGSYQHVDNGSAHHRVHKRIIQTRIYCTASGYSQCTPRWISSRNSGMCWTICISAASTFPAIKYVNQYLADSLAGHFRVEEKRH